MMTCQNKREFEKGYEKGTCLKVPQLNLFMSETYTAKE